MYQPRIPALSFFSFLIPRRPKELYRPIRISYLPLSLSFFTSPISHPSFQYTHPLKSIPSKRSDTISFPAPLHSPFPFFFFLFGKTSHLPTLRHHDIERGTLAADARALDFPHDVHAVGDAAEDDVFVVQERGGDGADEELGAVGVRAGVLLVWRMGAF